MAAHGRDAGTLEGEVSGEGKCPTPAPVCRAAAAAAGGKVSAVRGTYCLITPAIPISIVRRMRSVDGLMACMRPWAGNRSSPAVAAECRPST